MKIQDFINEKHKYKVDEKYQRPPDVWSTEDKQCLIDTIIKSEPMPMFFLNEMSQEKVFYIIDGQQRLGAIKDFHDNKLKLNKKFSGDDNHGKTFNGDNAISDELRYKFLNYVLNFRMLEDYDDEKIRSIFSRLQRGKPLQVGERLNAKPGSIVFRMREIAEHSFMKDSIGVFKRRYGNYPDAARVLFYEKHGAKQMGSTELYKFFEDNREMDKSDKDYRSAIRVLNYLSKCFPAPPGNYAYLEKHAWVLAVYTMVRELMLWYSMIDLEEDVRDFIKSFHGKIYSEDHRNSNPDYQRFYDNVRGGWSEKIICIRRDILRNHFIEKYGPKELGDKRQISDAEKASIYEENQGRCEDCGKEFKDFKELEYHHIERYADGGPSEKENIEMLCSCCHKKAHGKI